MDDRLGVIIDATTVSIEDLVTLLHLAIKLNDLDRIKWISMLIAFKNSITDEEISYFLSNDEILPSLYEKLKTIFGVELDLDTSVKLLLDPVLKFKN